MTNKVIFVFWIFLSYFYIFGSCSTCLTALSTVKCDCSDNKINCSGTQDGDIDLMSSIENFSSIYFASKHLEFIEINVDGFSFSPNSTFCRETVTNMSLGNGLVVIPDNIFICLNESLRTLNLRNNSFSVIPTGSLQILELLESLDLSYNKLENLNKSDFNGLRSLNLLNLTHNKIKHVFDETFYHTPSIKELYLDFNNLQRIEKNTFKYLSKLEFLSISSNLIQKFEPEAFQDLSSLKTLIIDNNAFSLLSNIDISSSSLTKLSAKNCSLHGSVKQGTFANIPNLVFLDLSYNLLVEVEPFALSNLKKLNVLNLTNNQIKYLRDDAFVNLRNLTELDLGNNEIIVVGSSAFYNLTNLKYLNLRENKLAAFIRSYAMDLISLEAINLENNQIRKVISRTFFFTPNLKSLKMSGNALECTCDLYDFASFLHNSTTLPLDDIESAVCSSGQKVIEFDFVILDCTWKTTTKDDYDDDFTTENTVNDTTTFGYHDTSVNEITTSEISTSSVTAITTMTTTKTSIDAVAATSAVTETSTVVVPTSTPTTTTEMSTGVVANSTPTTTTEMSADVVATSITTTEMSTDAVTTTTTTTAAPTPTTTAAITSTVLTVTNTTTEDYDYYDEDDKSVEEEPHNFTITERVTTLSVTKSKSINIVVNNYTFSDQNFCISWLVEGITFSKAFLCILRYKYETGDSAAHLTCPKSNNTFNVECRKIKIASMVSFCIDIEIVKRKTKLSRYCGDITKSHVTTEISDTKSVVTTATENQTSSSDIFVTSTEIISDTSDTILVDESATLLVSAVSSEFSTHSFSVMALIGIFIAVICVVIIILIRTRCRRNVGSVQYNVSKEEQKIQQRSRPAYKTEHSVRYSYTVNENVDLL